VLKIVMQSAVTSNAIKRLLLTEVRLVGVTGPVNPVSQKVAYIQCVIRDSYLIMVFVVSLLKDELKKILGLKKCSKRRSGLGEKSQKKLEKDPFFRNRFQGLN
jgi:hypothetical protein